jgi:anaerobic ribonucleoside-triphosphate reductase activating protein
MPAAARLRIHHILPASQANGPGWRAVLWLQGCTLACPGCFNPGTHTNDGGEWVEVEELYQRIQHLAGVGRILPSIPTNSGNLLGAGKILKKSHAEPRRTRRRKRLDHTLLRGSAAPRAISSLLRHSLENLEGITISGGEPLQQMAGLVSFLTRIRAETHLSVILFSGYTWTEIQAMPQAKRLLPLVDVLLAGRYVAEQRVAHGLLGSGNKTIHFLSNRYTAADLEAVPEAEVILTQNGEIIYSGINPLQEQDSPPGGGSTGS